MGEMIVQCEGYGIYQRSLKWFGESLKKAQEDLGFKRSDLGLRMGYKNLSKAGSRIASWERGEAYPDDDQMVRLIKALDPYEFDVMIASDAVQAAEEIYERQTALLSELQRKAAQTDSENIAQNRGLLCAQRKFIEAWPVWRNIRIADAKIVSAYLGGFSLSLGQLLKLWENELMLTPCDCCTEMFYTICAQGSPLSGSHQLLGFCDTRPELRAGKINTVSKSFLRFVMPIFRAAGKKAKGSASDWSLSQLLARLGVEVEQAQIFTVLGEEIGRYDFEQCQLLDTKKTVLKSFDFQGDAKPSGEWRDQHQTSRGLEITGLGPGQTIGSGQWAGEQLHFPSEWSVQGAWLVDPEGAVQLASDHTLPAAVWAWIAVHYDSYYLKPEPFGPPRLPPASEGGKTDEA